MEEGLDLVEEEVLEEVVEAGTIGNPYPSAKNSGLRRPTMPKGMTSSAPMKRARHSAGGGRCWKRLRDVDMLTSVEAGLMQSRSTKK